MDFCLPSSSPYPFHNIYVSTFCSIAARHFFLLRSSALFARRACIVSNISEKQILCSRWYSYDSIWRIFPCWIHICSSEISFYSYPTRVLECLFYSHIQMKKKMFHTLFYYCILLSPLLLLLRLYFARTNNKFKLQLQLKMKRTWRKLREYWS